ncbi:MAG: DUF481 domain-containing protein [Acidobacteriota bacterium]
MRRLTPTVAILVLLASFEASAATVSFKNGDRLTGEIETLFEGKLVLKTAHAGEVAVDFADVASIESNEPVKLYLKSGEVVKGAVKDLEGGWLGVRTENGIVTLALPMIAGINKRPSGEEDERAKAKEPEDSPDPASFSGHVALGGTVARGNSDGSGATADLAIFAETATSRYETELLATVTRDSAAGSQSEDIVALRWDRKLDHRWYLFTTLSAERDEAEALDLRGVFAAGAGRTLADRGRYRLLGEVGLAVDRRDPISELALPATTDAEALIGARLDVGLPRRTTLRARAAVYPDLSASGYRVEAAVGVATPIAKPLALNAAIVSQTTSNPLPGVRATDVGVRVGIAWTF